MPAPLFPLTVYIRLPSYRPFKDRRTGRIQHRRVGRKWVACKLWDPAQHEHEHEHERGYHYYYLSLCPEVSFKEREGRKWQCLVVGALDVFIIFFFFFFLSCLL